MEKPMNFDDYQKEARTTAIYDDIDYPRLALAEEVGELLGKIAKAKRDHRGYINEGRLYDIKKEGGDILWQLAAVLGDLGISMQEVAEMNIKKLRDRQQRGVLSGSGDSR
jgi:NTP pyrophosphatase (non-canonical NTP hydrolase)